MRLATTRRTFTVRVGGGEVDVSPLSATDVAELAKKHTRIEVKKGKPLETLAASAFGRELFARTVVGWRGYEGEGGAELACDNQTKAVVWDHNPDFAAEVLEAADEAARAWREEQAGN